MYKIRLLLIIAAFPGGGSRRFTRRMQEVTTRKTITARSAGAAARSLSRRGSATPGIDRIFRLLPRREALVERLGRTGREISVGQYMLATLAAIVVISLGVVIFTSFGFLPSLMLALARKRR